MKTAVTTAIILVFTTAAAYAGPPVYRYTDLGPGKAFAINNDGDVAGTFGLWRDGQFISVGFEAHDVSDTGIVVGVDHSVTRACIWQNGSASYLPGPAESHWSYAYGINDAGEVAGSIVITGGSVNNWSAAHWHDGTYTRLLGDTMEAYDINNNGVVVGIMNPPYADMHAFSYSGGVVSDLDPYNVSQYMQAFAVNDAGSIVGFDGWAGTALEYTSGSALTDGGIAFGLNEVGDVVGQTSTARAVLWHDAITYVGQDVSVGGGTRYDVRDLLETWLEMGNSSVAEDINDSGQIVGWYNDGSDHAFLLTPVPEPATLGLLMAGAFGLLKRRNGCPHRAQIRMLDR